MTIGIDLGDKWSRVCVLDEHGEICEEGRIATTTDAICPVCRYGSVLARRSPTASQA